MTPSFEPAPITLTPPVEGEPEITVDLALIEKESLPHETKRFRFALPSEKHILGLPVGQYISLQFQDVNGETIMRHYTPTSCNDTQGYVELMVRENGGKMCDHLESLKLGDTIAVSGPKGKLSYIGQGEIHIRHNPTDPEPDIRHAKKIGMIAGGTGITPMLQIVRHALRDPNDHTEFDLLLANQTNKDIICRDEIDQMARDHSNVKVWYTVDKVVGDPDEWKYSSGFVNKDMIEKHLPPPGPEVQIFMCGPGAMMKYAVLPALAELGFTEHMHFTF